MARQPRPRVQIGLIAVAKSGTARRTITPARNRGCLLIFTVPLDLVAVVICINLSGVGSRPLSPDVKIVPLADKKTDGVYRDPFCCQNTYWWRRSEMCFVGAGCDGSLCNCHVWPAGIASPDGNNGNCSCFLSL